MITIKKYAAIDIGSNAMRLLVTNIVEQNGYTTQFNKSSLVRVPIRLGQDAFTVGEITTENIERMIDAMKAFKLLMKVHKVEKYQACATSALREAYNGKEVVEIIKNRADIFLLVSTFYEKVRKDALLGPFFNETIQDWEAHLERLTNFWESNLFLKTKYLGNPLKAHVEVDEKFNHTISQLHFGTWLNLWFQTIDDLFIGDLFIIIYYI